MASKIDLVSNALILIGDEPISTLESGERRARVASNLYDSIVNFELSKHRWGFAKKKAQLSQTTDTPIDSEWNTIYQLPTDLITLVRVYPHVNYDVYGDKIYTNVTGKLTCDYIAETDESQWPEYFAKMIEYALAKDFAVAIRDSQSAKEQMAREYLSAATNAKYTDSQQHTTKRIRSHPFKSVRY